MNPDLAKKAATGLTGSEIALIIVLVVLIAVAVGAAILYFRSRNAKAAAPAAAPEPGGDSEIDGLVREADRRLAHANAGATIANLPLIFVIGDRATAKTSTVVNSGLEPELLAGQLYQDNAIAPTRAANLWFARGTALVEAGGAILGDPGNWMRLVKRLTPGRLKSLKGGAQSPRAVLLCVSLESFSKGADAVATATRYLQARLSDIAQTLGIRFPVYILYTKTDRVPFFTDFVANFSNEEASQVFGVTVPIRPAQQSGVYAEDETRRLTGYFDNLFYSLCDKRTIFPPRDNDVEKVCGAYEFPRELRKTRDPLVQFMVDVCRPSQLTTSPFLRGFYFSGVRPVVVNESAPVISGAPAIPTPGIPKCQRRDRDVPGWKTSRDGGAAVGRAARGGFPTCAPVGVPGTFVQQHHSQRHRGYGRQRIEREGQRAAPRPADCSVRGMPGFWRALSGLLSRQSNSGTGRPDRRAGHPRAGRCCRGALPTLGSLQQLENLRQSLEKLDGYEADGSPYRLRWGLYQGSNLYPEVHRLYYEKFRVLLFGQTKNGLLAYMHKLKSPPDPSAEYGYPYNSLKAYLLTTSEYKRAGDKSLQEFLGNLLLTRWSENREAEITKDRMDLAKKQFDYYARNLAGANPYSTKPDADAVAGTRVYLSLFKGPKRVYYGLLADAAKKGKAQNFNQWAEGSAATLASIHPIAFAYTKDGAKFMLDQIKNANFKGEEWVLGPDTAQDTTSQAEMQKGILDLYTKDYITEWRAVLKTSHVVPYKNLSDAADKLDKLTKSDAPILAVLWWTSQNTSLADMPDVNDAFKVPRQVEPSSAVAYVPSAQPYNDALQALQAALAKAAESNADPASVKTAQDAADAGRSATKKVSSGFPVDREGQLDSVVGSLMLEPITQAEKMFKGLGVRRTKRQRRRLMQFDGSHHAQIPIYSGSER